MLLYTRLHLSYALKVVLHHEFDNMTEGSWHWLSSVYHSALFKRSDLIDFGHVPRLCDIKPRHIRLHHLCCLVRTAVAPRITNIISQLLRLRIKEEAMILR